MLSVREKISHFERMLREMGGTIPTQVICKLAVDSGIDHSMALIEFITAAHDLHVDNWAVGLSETAYRNKHAALRGRVNIWAAVLRHIDVPPTREAAEKAKEQGR